jgi:hypothetical protein
MDDGVDFYGPKRKVPQEFSVCNQTVLKGVVESLPDAKLMVEIGVERAPNSPNCSTQMILQNRPEGCAYVGIDLRKCHYLKDHPNADFVQTDSRANRLIYETLDNWANEIDLLVIDGDHSVEWILTDWQYTSRLKVGGAVVLHDTNIHPGPLALLDAVDEEYFDKEISCTDGNDWGIAVLRLKKPLPCAVERIPCLVVQGPLMYVEELKPMITTVPTIWSTWEEEPEGQKDLLRSWGVDVVETPIPDEGLRGNRNSNLQIVSSEAGVLRAREMGYTHVFRVRHDVLYDNPAAMLENVNDRLGFLGEYKGRLLDYVISGPVDKLLLLFAGQYPQPAAGGKLSTELFLKRRYQHLFPYERLQYILPFMERFGITARWLRKHKSTVDPLNNYHRLPRYTVEYGDTRALRG